MAIGGLTFAADLLGFSLCLALAAVVVGVAPRARVNRLLAFYLVFNGLTSLDWLRQTAWGADRVVWYNITLLMWAGGLAAPFSYMLFVAHAVELPWLRALRRPAVRAVLVTLALLPFPIVLLAHRWIIRPVGDAFAPFPLFPRLYFPFVTLVVVGALVVSLVAYAAAAPGTLARRRALAYAVAFGLQDVALGVGFVLELLGAFTAWADLAVNACLLASLVALAVALLRFQLFDFALRVRIGIERSTLAAIFLATFFVVAEIAQNVLADSLGYVAGGVAAGALVFGLRPLERFASGVASTAVPRASESGYLTFKKLEVYRAAVESALEDDGSIDARERRLLDRLRDKLALDPADAAAVEGEALREPDAAAPAH